MKVLRDAMSGISGGHVLDIATGRGQFLSMMKDSLKDYTCMTGIDEHEASIKMAQEHFGGEDIQFLVMDATRMDFPDHSFDTICLSNSLHHMADLTQVFQEMKRVLKPEGLVIMNEMIRDNQTDSQLSHVYFHHLVADIDTLLGVSHRHTYTRDNMMKLLEKQGMKVDKVLDYNSHEEEHHESEEERAEGIQQMVELCHKQIDRLKDHEGYTKIQERGEQVEEWIKEHGMDGATQVITMGAF